MTAPASLRHVSSGAVIRRPAVILALLTALNLLNYLDRWVLSAVLEPLSNELRLTKVVTGFLGTVFLLGFFVTSPVFGVWADLAGRGGRKVLVAAGIAVWSVATLLSGVASTAPALIATRALVGVGEASYTAIAPTLIDDVAPRDKRSSWLGIFYAAIPIGSALGFVVGGAILHFTHSWRNAFFVAGGPGLVLAAVCLLIDEPEPGPRAKRPSVFSSAAEVLPLPLFGKITLGQCAYTFAIGGFGFWAPLYISERYGMEQGPASTTLGLVTVCGGALGTVLGGSAGDWVTRRHEGQGDEATVRANLWISSLAIAVAAPLVLLAVLAPTATLFFAIVLPCETALFFVNGPINFALLRSVPGELRASAMAFNIFAIHFFGDLWSPLLIGKLAMYGPMKWAMLLCPAMFAGAAAIWWEREPRRANLLPPG
jgi:MFS family permease